MKNENPDQELIDSIKEWLKDFNKLQPGNLCIDYDTFEGGAYILLNQCLEVLES